MSKEYIQALNDLFGLVAFQGSFTKAQKYFDIIEEALQRLESIDNSNPSEALKIFNKVDNIRLLFTKEEKSTITQALLKEQEPKQYLKWEDLEFKGEEQTMKVILNGSVHFLSYYRNMFSDNLCMIDNTGITIWKENKQFFNDLHLEKVEE